MRMFIILILILALLLAVWIFWSYLTVKNLEEPSYTVLSKHAWYEIRQYESYIVAEVQVSGNQNDALNSGFRYLAWYIFWGNSKQDSIKMTTPVSESTSSEKIAMTVPVMESENEKISMTIPVLETENIEQTRIVQFTMPSKYTLETLPKPDSERVSLREISPKKVAVLKFTWFATEKKVQTKKQELKKYLERDTIEMLWNLTSAQYNPPLSFPFTRRNEIITEIQ